MGHRLYDLARLHSTRLAGLSISNTVLFLDVFGVNRARSTVHNRVHKVGLRPETGRSPDHVAVDETVIRIDDEQYWLYAAVDPDSHELLHTKLEPTGSDALVEILSGELREKDDVDDAVLLVDGAAPPEGVCRRHGLDFRDERHGDRNSVERVFREVKRRTGSFSNCFGVANTRTTPRAGV